MTHLRLLPRYLAARAFLCVAFYPGQPGIVLDHVSRLLQRRPHTVILSRRCDLLGGSSRRPSNHIFLSLPDMQDTHGIIQRRCYHIPSKQNRPRATSVASRIGPDFLNQS
ncbi:uncharacterized protein B0T15DRAFT_508087 [Chaetomium strumarium]|uniref:Uncharacterized protein n=1 Tax=Chaetomium strumarium TaxID=1170767 RepID=A0AAJ0M7C3_9PEZI|nr:hypothetical protein B0T15DRAFT_508087 [Chaetomium strumarium]